MVNAPRGHHGQENIDEALKGVDPEVASVRFEVPGKRGSLLGAIGRFCRLGRGQAEVVTH